MGDASRLVSCASDSRTGYFPERKKLATVDDEDSRKAEVQRNESISMRLSEILTNDLHKYFYP